MRALLIVNPHATSTNERRRDLLAHALAGEMSLQVAHTREPRARLPAGRGRRGQRRRSGRRARRRRHRQRGGQRAAVPRRPARTRRCWPSSPAGRRTSSPGRWASTPIPTVATEQILEALVRHRVTHRVAGPGQRPVLHVQRRARASTPRRCGAWSSSARKATRSPTSCTSRPPCCSTSAADRRQPRLRARAAGPGPHRRRVPGLRVERRPVDVLRQPAGSHQSRHDDDGAVSVCSPSPR